MKKVWLTLALAAGPWRSGLAAQDRQAPPAPVIAIQFLGLSETQAGRFQQLIQNLGAAVGGLEQQISLRQQRMERLLNNDPPDPASVGSLLLEIRTLQKQAGQILQSYHESFLALLTSEQQEKVRMVIQAGQLFPAVRAFAELRLTEPPR